MRWTLAAMSAGGTRSPARAGDGASGLQHPPPIPPKRKNGSRKVIVGTTLQGFGESTPV